MDAFEWDNRFVTGLATVDLQHRHLVDLVNKVGDFLLENSGDEAALQVAREDAVDDHVADVEQAGAVGDGQGHGLGGAFQLAGLPEEFNAGFDCRPIHCPVPANLA